jgi:hypothetical protein
MGKRLLHLPKRAGPKVGLAALVDGAIWLSLELLKHFAFSQIIDFIGDHNKGIVKTIVVYALGHPFVFSLMLLAIAVTVILVHAYFSDDEGTEDEMKNPEDHPPAPVIQTASPVTTQTANPVVTQTANPNIAVSPTINNTINLAGSRPVRPKAPISREEPKHNVEFVGFRKYPDDGPQARCLVACFRNILIPHKPIGNFDYAKVTVTFYDDRDHEVLQIYPAAWLESEEGSPFCHIGGGETKSCIVAGYLNGEWKAFSSQKIRSSSWEGGSVYEEIEHVIPRVTSLKAAVVLIGEDNISLPPVNAVLSLFPDGNFTFKPQ